jgi:hypothetical protein
VHACALVAAPSRRCSAATTGSRRRSKSPQARRAPLFADGQLCHATGARLVPWRQPGGWGMKSLIASTAPFRPEPDLCQAFQERSHLCLLVEIENASDGFWHLHMRVARRVGGGSAPAPWAPRAAVEQATNWQPMQAGRRQSARRRPQHLLQASLATCCFHSLRSGSDEAFDRAAGLAETSSGIKQRFRRRRFRAGQGCSSSIYADGCDCRNGPTPAQSLYSVLCAAGRAGLAQPFEGHRGSW